MAKDFINSLGDTLSKTAKEIGGRMENIYEAQKLKNRIAGEERQIEKTLADLGRIVYKRYTEGIPVDEAQSALCEQVAERYEQISKYKKMAEETRTREQRICPSCGNILGKADAFCSRCGVACPVPEPASEDEDADIYDAEAEEVQEKPETEEKEEETIPEWKSWKPEDGEETEEEKESEEESTPSEETQEEAPAEEGVQEEDTEEKPEE